MFRVACLVRIHRMNATMTNTHAFTLLFGTAVLAASLQAADRDASAGTNSSILFAESFSTMPVGPLPGQFMVIQGEFEVKESGTNKLLELPGAPLDSHSVLFGPVTNANIMTEARILSARKGRRMPTFGVGLGGVAGYKVQVAPAKEAIELLLDAQAVTNAPFQWKSGSWTHCQLQIEQKDANTWLIKGRAWNQDDPVPTGWPLQIQTTEPPISGQASVLGSPFSGESIQFDDLRVVGVP